MTFIDIKQSQVQMVEKTEKSAGLARRTSDDVEAKKRSVRVLPKFCDVKAKKCLTPQ